MCVVWSCGLLVEGRSNCASRCLGLRKTRGGRCRWGGSSGLLVPVTEGSSNCGQCAGGCGGAAWGCMGAWGLRKGCMRDWGLHGAILFRQAVLPCRRAVHAVLLCRHAAHAVLPCRRAVHAVPVSMHAVHAVLPCRPRQRPQLVHQSRDPPCPLPGCGPCRDARRCPCSWQHPSQHPHCVRPR